MGCPCCGGGPGFGPWGWGRGFGPPPWAWRASWGADPGVGWAPAEPTKAQQKARLDALKADLEAHLAQVNEELGKL